MKLLALTLLAAALALAQHKIDYLVIDGSGKKGMEEKLTEAATEGYRFVDVEWRVSGSFKNAQITVFMQRKPGAAPERVQYKVIQRSRLAKLEEDLAAPGSGSTYEGPYEDGKRHGRWTRRIEGDIVYEGPYVDGKEHGPWVDAEGRTIIRYVNGLPQ